MRISDWSSDVCSSDLHRVDGEARPIKLIFKAISNAGAVFEPIIAGEAIQGEKIAVLKFHRARIFIGHAEIGELRRRDDLHPWRDLLRAAKRLSDKRPAHVYRRRRDAAGFPPACSPVDRGFGADILIAMIQGAAQLAGKGDFFTPGL